MTCATEVSDRDGIMATLRVFSQGMSAFDADLVVASWDNETDEFVFQPEERAAPVSTLEDLRQYVVTLPRVILALSDVRPIETKIDLMGEVAHVYVRLWCRLDRHGDTPMDGQIRQSFVLRRRKSGWRLVHYHESRQVSGFPAA